MRLERERERERERWKMEFLTAHNVEVVWIWHTREEGREGLGGTRLKDVRVLRYGIRVCFDSRTSHFTLFAPLTHSGVSTDDGCG